MKLKILILLLFLVITPSTYAIGIAPGEINTTAGTSQDFRFIVINNEHKDMYVTVGVEPGYKGKTNFTETKLYLSPTDNQEEFKVRIDVPMTADCGVIAKVYASEELGGQGSVGITSKVRSRIVVTECKHKGFSWTIPISVLGLIAVAIVVIYLYTHRTIKQ